MWTRRKSVRVRPVTLRGHWVQWGLIRPARGFDSRPRDHVHSSGPVAQLEAQLPCKEKVAGSNPARSTARTALADVAQRKRHGAQNAVSAGSNPAVSTSTANRTHLDVAQRKRTGFGSRGLGVRISPSRHTCEVVEAEPHLTLNQEDQVRALASQPHDASAVVAHLDSSKSACRLHLRSVATDGRSSSGVKGLTACRSNRRCSSTRVP